MQTFSFFIFTPFKILSDSLGEKIPELRLACFRKKSFSKEH